MSDAALLGNVRWKLSPKQAAVVHDMDNPQLIFRAALGAGKNMCGARWTIRRALANPPHVLTLVAGATYGLILVTSFKDICDCLDEAGIPYESTTSPIHMSVRFLGRKIIFLSTQNEKNLVGVSVGAIWHDEPGIVSQSVHRKLVARLRHPDAVKLWHLKTGSPEGVGWFHGLEQERSRITGDLAWTVTGATILDNPFVDDEYVARQIEAWHGTPLYKSYVLGIATPLTGAVFSSFDAERNVKPCDPRAGELVTAWDFNARHQTTACASRLPGPSLAIWGECVSKSPTGTSTEHHAQRVIAYLREHVPGILLRDGLLRDRQGRCIEAVIDASGDSLHTSASVTDMKHLENAGFLVRRVDNSNPLIRDSVENTNHYLRRGSLVLDGQRAPRMVEALQTHPYEKKSDPPKPRKWKSDEPGLQCDHFTDTIRYLCWDAGLLGERPTFRRLR